MQYYQVFISAEQTVQANRILDALIARQRVFGGPLIGGPARFLWNFKDSDVPESMREHKLLTLEQDYHYIVSYTREDLKDELPMEPNRSLRMLLAASFEGREETVQPEPVDAVAALTFVPKQKISSRTKSSNGAVGSRR